MDAGWYLPSGGAAKSHAVDDGGTSPLVMRNRSLGAMTMEAWRRLDLPMLRQTYADRTSFAMQYHLETFVDRGRNEVTGKEIEVLFADVEFVLATRISALEAGFAHLVRYI